MKLDVQDPSLVPLALRAVKTVATARGPLHPTQRTLLALVQRLVLGSEVDVDTLAPITPQALATELSPHADRARVIRGMVFTCLARGEVTPDDVARVEAYAGALGAPLHVVENLRQLAEGHLALLKFDVNRRAFTGQAIAQTMEQEGALALLRGAASRIGLREDAALVAHFEGMGDLPEGSLGRELHDYYVRNGFPLPGRKHALPSFGVVHDLCHVLSGYGVDGPGEVEVVSFQAGFMGREPLSTLFFIVLQAHLDVRLVQIAPGSKGMLDDPAMMERAIRAFKRGTAVKVDLFDHWDYGAILGQPLARVRADLGVSPPDAVAAPEVAAAAESAS